MRFTPNYLRAKYWNGVDTFNRHTEFFYFETLKKIKALIQQLPNEKDRLVYEKERKHEPNVLESLYDFFSPQVRFYLLCDFDMKCCIHYTVAKGPLEKQITELVHVGIASEFILHKIDLKPNYSTYYLNVMDYQKKFTHILQFC